MILAVLIMFLAAGIVFSVLIIREGWKMSKMLKERERRLEESNKKKI